MNKVIKVPLSTQGISKAIKAVEDYKRWLVEKTSILLDRLAAEGYTIASARFTNAVYDGTNDASVSVENRGEGIRAVVAVGSSVLFIEFGTGVTYPDTHPEAAKNGMVRGGYGQGKGNQKAWGYYGEPGTNGQIRKTTDKGDLIITHGNPANAVMYETVKELKSRLPILVKEVYQ